MRIHLGLRGKLVVVSIASVIIALAVSTFIDAQLARRAFTQRFIAEVTRLAKELAAGFGGSLEFDDWTTLTQKIHQIKEARADIRHMYIFARTSDNGWSLLASDEDPPTGRLSRQEVASLTRGRTLVDFHVEEDLHLWQVTTPIRADRQLIGALQFVISGVAVQADVAKERRQTLLMLAATVAFVSVALTIFVQRAVYRPMRRLVEAMQHAQAGSLDVQVMSRGHDELAQLTDHFNRMLLKIRQDTTEKEKLLAQIQQFNEELQTKIRAATQTLEQRNQELQQVNEALFHSQRQLAQWERLVGMVYQSASIAHEIGTPLHSIAGYIHLLLNDPQLSSDARRRLHIIESQLDRISDTLRTMLSSTRQPSPQIKPLNLNALLGELLQLTAPGMTRRHVRLHTDLQEDLPWVPADSHQLQQVFLNLLANALDAMPNGGELYVETVLEGEDGCRSDQSGRWVAVRIRDTGQGIPEEHISKIFDLFFTTKDAGQGTGIGLAICSQIIQAHGGGIEVQSQLGEGSTFTVRLPFGT
ncbi:MAG TPA: ATP-binding protein [Alphaproteobacteria bacterium]|nr:ATP-binding protein [Alphaproteobacteria bacterium]